MANMILHNSVELGDYRRPYIVAEINTSHFGSMDTAKEMIAQALSAGCDCVKFQSWSSNSLYSKTHYSANPMSERFVKKFAFSDAQLYELYLSCQDLGIAFASTPYSCSEVDFLVDRCNVPFIKVASMELNNLPYLRYIAGKGTPIVLSTGMGDMDEIRRAVDAITETGNTQVCILHCVSVYPTAITNVRLMNIIGLRAEFPEIPIGFSDHTLGIEMATAAVALGACLIEKHFTLDKSKIGMDNQMATETEEMRQLVKSCRNVQLALGDPRRVVFPEEMAQRNKMRRSVIYARNLKAGSILTAEDLEVKRPGNGLPPESMRTLVGKRLIGDASADTLVSISDLTDA